ncbi:DUF1996 domain-containing protein [Streptomyces sp. NPDC002845]
MGRNRRRRPTGARRATSAAVGLILGGSGLVVANVYASATETGSGGESVQNETDRTLASTGSTIDCPDVGSQLTAVPDQARPEVDKELAVLDQQIAAAYQRLQNSAQAIQQDSGFADSAIVNPLKEKRAATIERIAISIGRVGDRPQGLEALAACTLRASGNETDQTGGEENTGQDNGDQGNGGENEDGQNQGQGSEQNEDEQQGGNGGQAGNGPVAADYADITTVQPNVRSPRLKGDASRGTFTTSCGVNANGLFNSDNIIVAPGVTNGAHHFHDYIGNQANNAFASDEDLANADTTCENEGDKSTYYWPVLRLQNGTQERDADSPGGGIEGNAGEIVTAKQVTLTFVGSPQGKVTAMPRLLRIITGDAKAFVNGTANANASWSCTGFEDRQLKDKYPLCPDGSDVVRTFKFQSCWDGRNIDSANHRTHVAFADAEGKCGEGFQAIPQLVQRIVYDVDAPSLEDGGRTVPLFAVDSFPEQLHKPVTDHGDFINVFDEDLMRDMVDCINGGRHCDAGSDTGSDPGPGAGEEPQDKPTPTPDAPSGGNGEEYGEGDGEANSGNTGGKDTPDTEEPAGVGSPTARGSANPKAYTTPQAGQSAPATSPAEGSADDQGSEPDSADQTPTAGTEAPPAEAGSGTEPQAITGGLAETGAQLWPAAAGGVLVLAGLVLLRRIRLGSA